MNLAAHFTAAALLFGTQTETHAKPSSAQIDMRRLLWAIEQVESGGRWDIEGGALQFTHETWREAAHLLPYRIACFRPQAEIVAEERIRRFVAQCERLGVEPAVILLAEFWKSGANGALTRSKRGKFTPHARSVEALYLSSQPSS